MKRLLILISILTLFSGVVWGLIVWMRPPADSSASPDQIELAIQALKSGDEVAFGNIRKAFESDSRAADFEHFFAGVQAIREGEWERAESELSKVTPTGALRPYLLFARAESLYRMGRLSEAEWLLQTLVIDHEDHLDAHRLLGAIHYDLGSYDVALFHLNRVIELSPDSLGSHHLMGIMHHDFAQENEAIEHFQAALDLNPPDRIRQELLLELSQSLIAQQEYSRALSLVEQADPSVRSFALRARCLWNLDRKPEAREFVQSARKMDRESEDRLLCLIELQIYQDERNWEKVEEVALRYLKQDPYDAEIRYQLAQSYARMGRNEDFDRESALFKKHTAAARELSELNVKALKDPRDPILRDQLAVLCDSLGKTALAEMWREAARNCREGRAFYPESNLSDVQSPAP